jgi:hypothetical protein
LWNLLVLRALGITSPGSVILNGVLMLESMG